MLNTNRRGLLTGAIAASAAGLMPGLSMSGADGAERLAPYLQKGVFSLPVSIPANPYTYAVKCDGAFFYVASIGYDFGTGAYLSAKVEKFNSVTLTKVGETVLGAYAAHGAGEMAIIGPDLYVIDQFPGQLVRIAHATMTETGRLTIGSLNRGVCTDGTHIYVVDGGSNTVKKVDPVSFTVVASGATGALPFKVGLKNGKLYVPCFNGNVVTVLDAATMAVVTTITITSGLKPGGVVIDPSPSGYVYNLNYGIAYTPGSDTVMVIDPATDTIVATWPAPLSAGLHGGAILMGELWVTCSAIHRVHTYKIATGLAARPSLVCGSNPAFPDSDGANFYVPCGISNVVQIFPVIDTYR